jgi:hypothetical protein
MPKYKRKKFFVDSRVQGALALRTIFYWMGGTTVTIGIVALLKIIDGRAGLESPYADLWSSCQPIAIASLFLLPVIAYDMVQMSNRVAGPIVRLRQAMRQLAEGQTVAPLRFRENDFWREMADEFNSIAEQLQASRQIAARELELDGDENEPALTPGAYTRS